MEAIRQLAMVLTSTLCLLKLVDTWPLTNPLTASLGVVKNTNKTYWDTINTEQKPLQSPVAGKVDSSEVLVLREKSLSTIKVGLGSTGNEQEPMDQEPSEQKSNDDGLLIRQSVDNILDAGVNSNFTRASGPQGNGDSITSRGDEHDTNYVDNNPSTTPVVNVDGAITASGSGSDCGYDYCAPIYATADEYNNPINKEITQLRSSQTAGGALKLIAPGLNGTYKHGSTQKGSLDEKQPEVSHKKDTLVDPVNNPIRPVDVSVNKSLSTKSASPAILSAIGHFVLGMASLLLYRSLA